MVRKTSLPNQFIRYQIDIYICTAISNDLKVFWNSQFKISYLTNIIIGMILPGIFLIATGFIDCQSPYTAVILLTIGIGLSGFQVC